MLPTPISPAAENLTPSLVQEMTTDSPNCKLDVTHSNISSSGELDPLLGAGDDDRLPELREVTDNTSELSGGHLDHAGVVSLGDAEVLLVQVHQLHLVVGHLLLVGRLEHEGDCPC